MILKSDSELISLFSLIKTDSYPEKVLWLERLVRWVRRHPGEEIERVRFLLDFLALRSEYRNASANLIAAVLTSRPSVRIFTEMGVPSWTSFGQECLSRLGQFFIPPYSDCPDSLDQAIPQVFFRAKDVQWLKAIPVGEQNEIADWIKEGLSRTEDAGSYFLCEMLDALLLLTVKSAAITIRYDFAVRSPKSLRLLHNPLFHLQENISILRKQHSILTNTEIEQIEGRVFKALAESENIAQFVKKKLETQGMTIDLIYQQDRLEQYLNRIEVLSETVFSVLRKETKIDSEFWPFFLILVEGYHSENNLGALVKTQCSLFSRRIVDLTSVRGLKYIAQNPEEYRQMFLLALGGGFLTAFTVVAKYAVPLESWPLFIEYLYSFLNYSASFVLMEILHFKLATKQPSMTAAAFALKLEGSANKISLVKSSITEEFAKVTRTQIIAVFGNLLAVIPAAILFSISWKLWTGQTFLDDSQARHILESIHPTHTNTILFAGMTGFLLWLSGLTAGWAENVFFFHRFAERIRTHRLIRRALGASRSERLAIYLSNHISGLSSAISLGSYLAIWPVLGKFFGVSLEIRHITLVTGSVAMAVQTLGIHGLSLHNWFNIFVAITLIGCMNFIISFALSMTVAIHAKGMSSKRTQVVFRKLLGEVRKNPMRFIMIQKFSSVESKNLQMSPSPGECGLDHEL